MNPVHYSIAEMKKAAVALVTLILAMIGLFVAVEPGFTEACVSLTGAVFAVFGVFAAKNSDPEDIQKALEQFKGAALAVVGYFTVVPTSTVEKIGIMIGALVSIYAVWKTSNVEPGVEPEPEPEAALQAQ
jgi:hypothetical protein